LVGFGQHVSTALLKTAALIASLGLMAVTANAVPRSEKIRIKILDAESRSVSLDDSGVPKNCDGLNYDAYCHSSQTVQVTNALLAQEDGQQPFWITCSADTKWSRCAPLATGESFDARREKHGLLVYFEDEKGKARQQLYALVGHAASNPALTETTETTQPAASGAEEGKVRAPSQAAGVTAEAVKCRFTSVPPGADITLDGRYVGSTPSVLSLSSGVHSIAISLPGFAHWSREMTVSSDAELTVNAILEKAQ